MRILLADDEKDFARALQKILEHSNYTVQCAYDGEEALYYAQNEDFDLLLLDIMMPKLDGFQLLDILRKNNRETPVLFLSAKDQIEDKVKGLRTGADDYLTKPFAMEELLARIEALRRVFNFSAELFKSLIQEESPDSLYN